MDFLRVFCFYFYGEYANLLSPLKRLTLFITLICNFTFCICCITLTSISTEQPAFVCSICKFTFLILVLVFIVLNLSFLAVATRVDATVLSKDYDYSEEGKDIYLVVLEFSLSNKIYTVSKELVGTYVDVNTRFTLYVDPSHPQLFSMFAIIPPNKYLLVVLCINLCAF
jgi:hypothetical protein